VVVLLARKPQTPKVWGRVPTVIARVTEKKSLNVSMPSMKKASSWNVFEIRNLSLARYLRPKSITWLGRLTSPVMVYDLGVVVFGCAAGGVGGQPVTLKLKFRPAKFSRYVEFAVERL